MPYSDSMHFFDKFSYKILFISSYDLKDINFARLKHFLQFSENRKRGKRFLTQVELARTAVSGSGSLTGHQGSIVADKVSLPVREKGLKIETKRVAFICNRWESNSGCQGNSRNEPVWIRIRSDDK
jgi:hypothetical protein